MIHIESDMDAEQPLKLVDQIGQAVGIEPLHEVVDVEISRAERPGGLLAAKKSIDIILYGGGGAQDRLLS